MNILDKQKEMWAKKMTDRQTNIHTEIMPGASYIF